ncbi:hypothetical protein Bbu156a_Z03 (plasmid) [Borreliella burgdorferi 156a]|nr:hypothetical protein Bbu156a_Z03 [Borreliella burgdorferi 156a]
MYPFVNSHFNALTKKINVSNSLLLSPRLFFQSYSELIFSTFFTP